MLLERDDAKRWEIIRFSRGVQKAFIHKRPAVLSLRNTPCLCNTLARFDSVCVCVCPFENSKFSHNWLSREKKWSGLQLQQKTKPKDKASSASWLKVMWLYLFWQRSESFHCYAAVKNNHCDQNLQAHHFISEKWSGMSQIPWAWGVSFLGEFHISKPHQ